MENFPWTLDQFQRYSVLREFLEVFYPGRLDHREKKIKVLDVGGLSPDRQGQSFWLPVKRVLLEGSFALDINFCAEKRFIQGEGTKLPFKEESFDVTAALDVVEHVRAERREEFIREMCRVTRGSIVVSAPFHDAKIEETEALLFEEIRGIHGAEHRQLLEHKACGLPDIKSVSEALANHMPAGAGFYFGSLENWLFHQTLRNCFLLRRNAAKIQKIFDRWMSTRGHSPESEFEPPFSRHFWVYSKTIGQEALESGIEKIKEALKRRQDARPGYEEAVALNKEVADFFSRERVSAVIVTEGEGKYLMECLNHVLTQRVDFDFEVCVFDVEGNSEKERNIKTLFPAVKYLMAEKGEKAPNTLLRIASRMAGDFILLLSDDILLPPESALNFYQKLKNSGEIGPITARVAREGRFTPVWTGARSSLAKILAGRAVRPSRGMKEKNVTWIFSPCLFFKKEALYERKFKARRLTKRSVFFWEKETKPKPTKLVASPILSDVVVYKKD
ncbi:MAG: methyltransferase domain-containing protein [Clostridiales bacterium]|nr:methyltransferase domain-containing protein [Clostridiales bacterium]